VETKRFLDFKNPGSQGDGSFFGITDDFKGKENGYPGGWGFGGARAEPGGRAGERRRCVFAAGAMAASTETQSVS
jgi:hypothetical protein